MMKRFLVITLASITLAGCANTSTLSGDVYSASDAKQVQTVTYGTVVSTRPVQIQAGDKDNAVATVGGAILGGVLGHTLGGGTGKTVATAVGAGAGALAGNAIGGAANRVQGVELEIRKDDGTTIMVVQKQGDTKFHAGQRVAMASNGSAVTVSAR
ncbi:MULTISPECIES: outer membrane lipoprotein [Dickeya]|uniref:Outer membrane lipoprotein pcp n=1 Tax=Dickeya aquatica TaxID=1401087 RepID=A0A375ADB5_9GAMM|nr:MULTISPECIES: glycine zipper 2TM domain-containing protein [Dickeya]SLM63589.1 Outer membrane lipoprotein pcp precursor [Dickeya aquatica]